MNKYFVTAWQGHEFSEPQVFFSGDNAVGSEIQGRRMRRRLAEHSGAEHSGTSPCNTAAVEQRGRNPNKSARSLLFQMAERYWLKEREKKEKAKKRTLTFSFLLLPV